MGNHLRNVAGPNVINCVEESSFTVMFKKNVTGNNIVQISITVYAVLPGLMLECPGQV